MSASYSPAGDPVSDIHFCQYFDGAGGVRLYYTDETYCLHRERNQISVIRVKKRGAFLT